MKALPICLLLLGTANCSWGTIIHFDEFGTTTPISLDGIHFQGVLFGFLPGGATYNEVIGTAGTSAYSTDPVMSGPTTGTLTLTFDAPTPLLQFDILLESVFPIDDSSLGPNGGPAYTVLLSNGLSLTGGTSPQPTGLYSEGEFAYVGGPITSAAISFFNGADAGGMPVDAFALDNLAFSSPEPGTFFGLGLGLVALGIVKWRRSGSLQ